MINPAHLDLFRAVIRHGGMTRAAHALGLGQPHVSRAMAALEAELRFPLFVRGHGAALPTEAGEAFAREVEQTYAGLDHLSRAARRIAERGTGALRIACQPSLAARLLPRAIRRLDAEVPGVRVSVHVPGPDTIWAWAASGQCDIGLARPRDGYTEVTAQPFLTMDAVCAVPRGHRLAGKRHLGPADLVDVPLISGGPGPFQQAIEAAFAAEGVAPRIVLTAQFTAARCGLVAEGMGVTIVDPVPARELSGLPIALRPFRPALPIETMLLMPTARPPGRLAQTLVRHLEAERDALVEAAP
ncbi:LysR family transcriptional regulator [Methylorubrum salsuginis]|uniref:DNA-binding transcriptional regulator, LysR family n=1 Tax=Methylorubrum salsuginis TaxID=414703 RepID=A0A1I4B6K9_9HYPH|nr:LysR family transcriptional regulator [Methylorubrum salsuginis]SFK64498.1 DNA-binding transcriptional regulator, LysR family [Methylorubrum salsuginis]